MVMESHWKELMVKHTDLLVAFVDAQAAAMLVPSLAASAPGMMFVLNKLQALPIYKELLPKLAIAHTYGEGNGPADWASRGLFKVLKDYCLQARVSQRQVRVPQAALELIMETACFMANQ